MKEPVLKFRAWDTKNKKYHYFEGIWNNHRPFIERSTFPQYESSPEYYELIIEQFTSFEDKKTKDIYAGDITADKCVVRIGVFTIDYATEVYGVYKTDGVSTWGLDPDFPEIIIGNIHENPELLVNSQ